MTKRKIQLHPCGTLLITLPANITRCIGVNPGEKLNMRVENGKIIMEKCIFDFSVFVGVYLWIGYIGYVKWY